MKAAKRSFSSSVYYLENVTAWVHECHSEAKQGQKKKSDKQPDIVLRNVRMLQRAQETHHARRAESLIETQTGVKLGYRSTTDPPTAST